MKKNMSITTQKEKNHQEQINVSHDEVAQRAYQLWQAAGQPIGRDAEYWLQAEAELIVAKRRGCSVEANASPESPKRESTQAFVSAGPQARRSRNWSNSNEKTRRQ
jgi:hypothetical protein